MAHRFPSPQEFLKNHNLRKTSCRVAILESFLKSEAALSHQKIEEELREFDRVTIYRTLSSFEKKGILHRVPDTSGQTKYALCESNCTDHHHNENHVHFKCRSCENVYCLAQIELPYIELPKGYQVEEADFLLSGICQTCNEKATV